MGTKHTHTYNKPHQEIICTHTRTHKHPGEFAWFAHTPSTDVTLLCNAIRPLFTWLFSSRTGLFEANWCTYEYIHFILMNTHC